VLPDLGLLKEGAMKLMKLTLHAVIVASAAIAGAQMLKTDHHRLGQPDTPPAHTVRSATDPADMDGLHSPSNAFDPLLEAELDVPSGTYGAGATPQVTVRLKRSDGSLMAGTVYTDDAREKTHRNGQRGADGAYTVALDNAPGEHFLDVSADVVVNGSSTHRGVSLYYEVGTGRVTLVDVGPTRQDATTLYVPLILNVGVPERYSFGGNLTAHGIAVASAMTTAVVSPGMPVDLEFALSDLVEPGPYYLTSVTVTGTVHKGEAQIGGIPSQPLADARSSLGGPIHVQRNPNVGPRVPEPTLTAEDRAARDAVLNPPAAPGDTQR
jgi:hypothetical protein